MDANSLKGEGPVKGYEPLKRRTDTCLCVQYTKAYIKCTCKYLFTFECHCITFKIPFSVNLPLHPLYVNLGSYRY